MGKSKRWKEKNKKELRQLGLNVFNWNTIIMQISEEIGD